MGKPASRLPVHLLMLTIASTAFLSGCVSSHAAPSPVASHAANNPAAPAGHIVFRRFLDAQETTAALIKTNTDGTHSVTLTHPAAGEIDSLPDRSPDGSKIIFTKILHSGSVDPNHPETHQIVEINADGSGSRALAVANPPAGQLVFNDKSVFSPDGTSIAYTHGDGSATANQLKNTGIYIMKADGSGAHEVIESLRRPTRRSMTNALRSFILDRVDVADEISAIDVPCLYIASDDRGDWSPEGAIKAAQQTPNATAVTIPRARTLIPLEQPQLVAEHLSTFWSWL